VPNIATIKGIEKFKGMFDRKILTNSSRSDFLNCRQKFKYVYVMGLVPRKMQVPFIVGDLFHKIVEQFYKKEFTFKWACETIDKKIKEVLKENVGFIDDEEIKGLTKQGAMLKGIAKAYAQVYKEDNKAWKVLSTELPFKIKIPFGWAYAGKLDMLVRVNKDMFVVEHKTTSRLDEGYISRLPLDNQIIGYSWAVLKLYKQMPRGVFYNVVRKTKLKGGAMEKLEALSKRIIDDYLLNPSKYFYREKLVFSSNDLQRFQMELFKLVEEMETCEEKGFYYKNPAACTLYNRCPYMSLCIGGISDETLLLFSVKETLHTELSA